MAQLALWLWQCLVTYVRRTPYGKPRLVYDRERDA